MCAASTAEPGSPGCGPKRYQPTSVTGGTSSSPDPSSPTSTTGAAKTPSTGMSRRAGGTAMGPRSWGRPDDRGPSAAAGSEVSAAVASVVLGTEVRPAGGKGTGAGAPSGDAA